MSHGDENTEGVELGMIAAIDGSQTGDIKMPIWADKGTQLRTNALTYLFPQPADLADLIARLDAWLVGVELADFVHRIVSERRDDAARSLRCQQVVTRVP